MSSSRWIVPRPTRPIRPTRTDRLPPLRCAPERGPWSPIPRGSQMRAGPVANWQPGRSLRPDHGPFMVLKNGLTAPVGSFSPLERRDRPASGPAAWLTGPGGHRYPAIGPPAGGLTGHGRGRRRSGLQRPRRDQRRGFDARCERGLGRRCQLATAPDHGLRLDYVGTVLEGSPAALPPPLVPRSRREGLPAWLIIVGAYGRLPIGNRAAPAGCRALR